MAVAGAPFRVSTITATASLCSPLDINAMYAKCEFAPDAGVGIVRAEFIDEDKQPVHRGFGEPKKKPVRRKHRVKDAETGVVKLRRFANQVTFIVRVADGGDVPDRHCVNIKVFKNGNLQMTGLKSVEQGAFGAELLLQQAAKTGAAMAPQLLRFASFNVRLINSDFKVGFEVDNKKLHAALTETPFVSIYEPDIYPGVKILFYANEDKTGDGGACKKVTIAVFRTGAVIITGANTMEMLGDAYGFISGFLKGRREEVERRVRLPIAKATAPPEKGGILRFFGGKTVG
jgi:TATA-box binding protein (TBP) (component of TFIID and TFIIIB)